jgi:hypothetical protein
MVVIVDCRSLLSIYKTPPKNYREMFVCQWELKCRMWYAHDPSFKTCIVFSFLVRCCATKLTTNMHDTNQHSVADTAKYVPIAEVPPVVIPWNTLK